MRSRRPLVVGALLLALFCGCQTEPPLQWRLLPAAPWGSRYPRFAGSADSLCLTYLAPEGDSGCALYGCRLDGGTPSTPVRLAWGNRWLVNWADVPSVAIQRGTPTVAWLEHFGDARYAYGVRVREGVQTSEVTPSAWLHTDTSSSEHGFVSLVREAGGNLRAVWLDGRETVADGPTILCTAHLAPGGTPQHEALLDPRVCDCCPTSAVTCADGDLLVAYRDRSAEEVRDIAVTRLSGTTWSEPRIVNRDEWKIDGCPVNGPVLAASDSLVALAWFTMSGGVDPTVNVAFSSNCGETFGAPVRVDHHHAQGRVDLTWLPDGAALVIWVEAKDSVGTLWARRVYPGGADSSRSLSAISVDRTSGQPRVASFGGRTFVAWTEGTDSTRVRTAELRW